MSSQPAGERDRRAGGHSPSDSGRAGYDGYVTDAAWVSEYTEYQRRYVDEPRESDRVIVEIVRRLTEDRSSEPPLRVLDIGCSTGNLLRHLRRSLPGLELWGGDLMDEALEACRNDPQLDEVRIEHMDLLEIPEGVFDIVIINAVLQLLGDADFLASLESARRGLRAGGHLIAFEQFNPFEQDLVIRESSLTHPQGLLLHFRTYSALREACERAGLDEPEITPFEIPIDLPRPERIDDIRSYTRRDEHGARLLFRGAIAQCWCHVVAARR